MYAFDLILISFLVSTSSSIPVGYGSDLPYTWPRPDFYNSEPCVGSNPCRSLFPSSPIRNIYPANYLTSGAVVGSDVLSTVPVDYANSYPYAYRKTVNFAKENYIRDYSYGSSEIGIRDQISVRSKAPAVLPPYPRICSYFPIGTCARGINRYPLLPVDYNVAF